jgi:hypothetical protein
MGKLNILHHKEWHVYSKVNRDKVKEDEKNQAEQEAETQRRLDQIESERRLSKLREKAKLSQDRPNRKDARKQQEPEQRHINFFQEAEKYKDSEIVVDEKTLEQKKYEDKHTWYLGETRDGKKDRPWYTTMDYGKSDRDKHVDERKKQMRLKRDEYEKHAHDPMTKIRKDQRKDSQPGSVSKKSNNKPNTIQELRAERMQREMKERSRANAVLNPNAKTKHETEGSYYNSQYNRDAVAKRH